MHHPTLAGRSRRTRRALLAAALPAALAAVALPSAAQAGTVEMGRDGANLFYIDRASPAQANNVTVRANSATEIVFTDPAGVSGDTNICRFPKPTEAHCDAPRETVHVHTRDGNDQVEFRAPHPGFVDLGDGDDVLVAGTRQPIDGTIRPVTLFDTSGTDTLSYARASRGVSLTPEDGLANDGRPGDRENVSAHFETVIGSNFSDAPLFGTAGDDRLLGLGGNDQIGGGDGDDRFLTSSVADGSDDFHGAAGHDTISYGDRTQRVLIDLDNVADDGEPGENDNVRSNVEGITGSKAGDFIVGDNAFDVLNGGPGDDQLHGLGGNDLFLAGAAADGADRITGGLGVDHLFYGARTRAITATPDAGDANDGEAGERDTLNGVEAIAGSSAGDDIRAPQGSRVGYELFGGDGVDRLEGADGRDTIDGGDDPDTIVALGENDTIFARDGKPDAIGCGSGIDTAHIDSDDVTGGCENEPVGVLRIAPATVHAKAGKPVRVKLSWRHPQRWKQLRTITLRLKDGLVPVGEATIRPRGGRIGGDGAVKVQRTSRIATDGKTVTAHLALRLDDALAGHTLEADVEAVDRRGRRQLERDAATLRIAR